MIRSDREAQRSFLTRFRWLHRKGRIAKKRAKNADRRSLREAGLRVSMRETRVDLRDRVMDEVVRPAWERGLTAEIDALDPLFD